MELIMKPLWGLGVSFIGASCMDSILPCIYAIYLCSELVRLMLFKLYFMLCCQ